MLTVPAIKIVQAPIAEEAKPMTLFVTSMTLEQLAGHAKVDMWTTSNADGYQRPLVERRLRDLARYVLEEEGILPTAVLVGIRPQDDPKVQIRNFEGNGRDGGIVHLDIPEGAPLWIIDGQHRFHGVQYAYERGTELLAAYPFPVCIMWDVDRFAEMLHFNIINTRQKKMSTDIVDRHLVQIQKVHGLKMMAAGARGEKEYARATATQLVDQLNDAPGIWHHQISIPGVPGRENGLIRQHAMVVSIEPFLRDPWVKGATEDDRVKVLVNFWEAVKEVWADAFENPKDYRVQATVGIYSLHLVLPVIIQRCLEERDLTTSRMKSLLEGMNITSEFWHKEDGDPLTLGTGMASIRALSQYFIDQLPQGARSGVKI